MWCYRLVWDGAPHVGQRTVETCAKRFGCSGSALPASGVLGNGHRSVAMMWRSVCVSVCCWLAWVGAHAVVSPPEVLNFAAEELKAATDFLHERRGLAARAAALERLNRIFGAAVVRVHGAKGLGGRGLQASGHASPG